MIGNKIIKLEETESTNSFAYEKLKQEKLSNGTVFSTKHQISGKGRGTNIWESAKNKNLLFSIVLYPEFLVITKQFYLSKSIALGISDFLEQYTTDISIKWPNDIYAGNKKICGTLIEQAISGKIIQHSIVGIGVNINQLRFSGKASNPVSLKKITGISYNLDNCLELLLFCLDNRYSQLVKKDFKTIDTDYNNKLFRYNKTSKFKSKNTIFEAKIKYVDSDGSLVLSTKDKNEQHFTLDEIEFVF